MSRSYLEPVSSEKAKKAEERFREGLKLLKKRKPKEASSFLSKALELNPAHERAKELLQDAIEASNWNTAYFCPNCGSLIEPSTSYPDIEFIGECRRCGQIISTVKERAIGSAEFIIKLVLFGMFPVAASIFCIFPTYSFKWGGAYLQHTYIISAIFLATAFTPFFVLLNLAFDPSGETIKRAFDGITGVLTSLNNIHPGLFFTAEIMILYVAFYLCFLFVLTPIFYIHRKGHWRSRDHQKKVLLITSVPVALVIVVRLAAGVFR